MTLQERLKTLRSQVGVTIEKMASELTANGYSITFKTISGYEKAFRQPSVQFLTGLTNVYDANPNWLLTGNGEMFLNRVFTQGEIEYCESRGAHKFESYAGRFAAKEAIFKAVSDLLDNKFEIEWKDIEVFNDKNGRPYAKLQFVKIDDIKMT